MSVGFKSAQCECGRGQKSSFVLYTDEHGNKRRNGVCVECRKEHVLSVTEAVKAKRVKYNVDNRTKKRTKDAFRRAEIKAFVDAYKNKPCADCGNKFPSVAMDLDHVRGIKIRNVSGFVSGAYKLDLVKIELEKCDVVCACCHRVRTALRKENSCSGNADPAPKNPKPKSLGNAKSITINGETRSISEWERRLGIPRGVASTRLRRGYSVEQSFATTGYTSASSPIVRQRTEITALGKTQTVYEWEKLTGIKWSTIRHRLKKGWTPDQAVSIPPYGAL